jgi:hypothetical protein
MKKIIFLIFTVVLSGNLWSQELHILSGTEMYVSPKSYVYIDNNIDVDGDLIISSSATDSGSLIVSGTATGSITYERYIDNTDWHFVSAPVTTQDIGTFAIDPLNAINSNGSVAGNYAISIYNNENPAGSRWEYYNTAAAGSLPALASAGNFVNAKGYANKRTSAGNYTFKGVMATADVSIMTGSSTSHTWSLVGNPYPSFLPANNSANGNNNILAENLEDLDVSFTALYFYDGSSYQIINHASPSLDIAPGQGFMVAPKQNNVLFSFPEDLQRPQQEETDTFYRSEGTPEVIVNLYNGTETKKTTLKYFSNMTTGLDPGYDAGTYEGTADITFAIDTHLVTDSQGINFTLQCLPDSNYEASIVPLSIKSIANQTLTFSAIGTNLPEGIEIYLEDKVANTITNISTTEHQVTVESALDGIGRFYLHTSSSVLSIDDPSLTSSALNIYKTSNTNLRVTSIQQHGIALVKMYSIQGIEILSHSFHMESVNDIPLPKNLATGVYIIHLVGNGIKQNKKIIIE